MTGQENRLAFLDSLRFLAAGLVLIQHIFERRTEIIRDTLVTLGPGVAGVAIFFFISGYVIPMTVRGEFRMLPFIVRRLFRIYPLYLAAILLIAIAGAIGALPQWAWMMRAGGFAWASNLLLVQDFVGARAFLGVSWTLAIELIWYALFATGLMLFRSKAADRLDIFVPLALLALAFGSLALDVRAPLGRPTMIYAAVIGYQCFRFHAGTIDARRLASSVAIFALVALATNFVSFGVFQHPRISLTQALGPWTVGTVLFLVAVLVRPIREARLLNAGLLPWLGAMSYSTYLLHPIALSAARNYVPDAAQLPVMLAAVLLVSWLGYRFVELPGIAAGRRLVAGRTPITRTVAA